MDTRRASTGLHDDLLRGRLHLGWICSSLSSRSLSDEGPREIRLSFGGAVSPGSETSAIHPSGSGSRYKSEARFVSRHPQVPEIPAKSMLAGHPALLIFSGALWPAESASSELRSSVWADDICNFMGSAKRHCTEKSKIPVDSDVIRKQLISDSGRVFKSKIPEQIREDLIQSLILYFHDIFDGC